jgi:hypothetical protein
VVSFCDALMSVNVIRSRDCLAHHIAQAASGVVNPRHESR